MDNGVLTMSRLLAFTFVCTVFSSQLTQAQDVDPSAVLGYKPIQSDVDIESPDPSEVSKCKLDVERSGKGSGWALYGPQGQILRRFLDTDGDSRVDEYRYFKHGLEVYRDVDTNGDNEIDQMRFMNTAGTRWGIDKDQDGTVDEWRIISAEEASREAVTAVIKRDVKRLAAVMVNAADLKEVGISGETAQRVLDQGKDLTSKMRKVTNLNAKSRWVRFDSSMLMPNLIPADNQKTSKDVIVYENVMAIVDTEGKNTFMQIGEMIRIGNTWKLTQVPSQLDGDRFEVAEGGIMLQPSVAAPGAITSGDLSPEMKKLIDDLRALDNKAPQGNATKAEMVRYNVSRAKVLEKVADIAPTAQERNNWWRQLLEGIAAGVQMDTFPNGIKELQRIETKLTKSKAEEDLIAFAIFQRLLAEYNLSLQNANAAERPKVQEQWLSSLQAFIKRFPTAPDSAFAMLQLAITYEFNGSTKNATSWYQKLVTSFPTSQPGQRAKGALRRLDLKGKRFDLSGPSLTGGKIDLGQYRGKVVAVIFWATWCQPCTEDLPQIQELYRVYQREGFEIVGVNLDATKEPIQAYLNEFKVKWPHIREEGALESPPAVNYGVISLPTIIIVDKNGAVASSSSSVDEMKTLVPQLLKK